MSLDIGVNCIGVTILNDDETKYGKIIELTHINPQVPNNIKGVEALCLKKKIFQDEFLAKWQNKGITKVVIESPNLTVNNNEMLTALLQFNGMISSTIYEMLNIVPIYISSADARKYAFPELMGVRKYNKQGEMYPQAKIIDNLKKNNLVLFGTYQWDVSKKNIIHDKVASIFPQIEWLYDKNGDLKKENFDATDSYVAALGYLNREKYGELEFNISDIQEKEVSCEFTLSYWNKVEKRELFFV